MIRPFDSHDAFHREFLAGLHRSLHSESLGAFILVLANSLQHPLLRSALLDDLQTLYEKLYPAKWGADAVADDIRVFERLAGSVIADMHPWTFHRNGLWTHVVNPMRALRPPRNASLKVERIERDFDADGFHFDKPYLASEVFGRLDIHGCDLTLMFNKFPYMPYHYLLVPECSQRRPQLLEQSWLEFIWRLSGEVAGRIDGAGFGYSSIGACASVNHLHFQGFIYAEQLGVEDSRWSHNGGDQDYPVTCERFTDMRACWESIETLHSRQQAYNLLFREGGCYLFVRRMQGSEGIAERLAGAGWCELSGVFNESHESDLTALDEEQITEALATLKI